MYIFQNFGANVGKITHINPLIREFYHNRASSMILVVLFFSTRLYSREISEWQPLYLCRLAKAPPKSLNLEISTSAKLLTWPYLRQVCQYRQEFPVLGRSDRLKRRSGRSAPSARRHRRNPKPPPPASQQPFGPGGWQSEGSIKTQWTKFIGNEDSDNDNMHN